MFRKKLVKLVAVSASTVLVVGGGLAFVNSSRGPPLYSKSLDEQQPVVGRFEPTTKWDFNWDKREPNSLIKPSKRRSMSDLFTSSSTKPKEDASSTSQDDSELIKKHSSRATRHLFLIRHGQYELKEKDSEKKILTQLGKTQ